MYMIHTYAFSCNYKYIYTHRHTYVIFLKTGTRPPSGFRTVLRVRRSLRVSTLATDLTLNSKLDLMSTCKDSGPKVHVMKSTSSTSSHEHAQAPGSVRHAHAHSRGDAVADVHTHTYTHTHAQTQTLVPFLYVVCM